MPTLGRSGEGRGASLRKRVEQPGKKKKFQRQGKKEGISRGGAAVIESGTGRPTESPPSRKGTGQGEKAFPAGERRCRGFEETNPETLEISRKRKAVPYEKLA